MCSVSIWFLTAGLTSSCLWLNLPANKGRTGGLIRQFRCIDCANDQISRTHFLMNGRLHQSETRVWWTIKILTENVFMIRIQKYCVMRPIVFFVCDWQSPLNTHSSAFHYTMTWLKWTEDGEESWWDTHPVLERWAKLDFVLYLDHFKCISLSIFTENTFCGITDSLLLQYYPLWTLPIKLDSFFNPFVQCSVTTQVVQSVLRRTKLWPPQVLTIFSPNSHFQWKSLRGLFSLSCCSL